MVSYEIDILDTRARDVAECGPVASDSGLVGWRSGIEQ